jgi:phosphatidylglycerophosphatase A
MKYFYFLVSTFFGVGKIPFAPGTWGSLVGVLLFYRLIGHPYPWLLPCILAGIYFLGVFTTTQYAKEREERDPPSAVIDEVMGMGVAMIAIPNEWPFFIMSIIFFRICDIWKPYPIRKLERLPGGWGIMTDDLLAGIYARVWLQIGIWCVHYLQ